MKAPRLAGVLAGVALVGACTGSAGPPTSGGTGPTPTGATTTTTATATTTEPVDPSVVLAGPDRAATAGAQAVLAAGHRATAGPWRETGTDRWAAESAESPRPVYVGRVDVPGARDRVRADLAVATPVAADTSRLVLRLLPAAAPLGGDRGLEVSTTVDGTPAEATVDRDGARLLVPLPGRVRTDGAVLVRVRLAYRVPDLADVAEGGAAGFGLLARSTTATTLGHWLPLLTLPGNRGPVVSWGDVGAFPPAVWSLQIHTPATVLTGGVETPCPGVSGPCVLARGVALRDLSAVAFDETATATAEAGELAVRAAAPPSRGGAGPVADAVAAAADSFRRRFGPLAWTQLDTVAVPFRGGVAGMEFPGLSLISEDAWGQLDGGFGSFVIAHEVAHQWFHALVGNGSLDSPVVDESLAQYLSILHYRDAFGADAASRLVEQAMRGRYRSAVEAGVSPEPPAQPAGEFAGAEAYGALIYGRAPLAWLAAEEAVGAPPVVSFLAAVVDEHGLGAVSDDELLAMAERTSPAVGRALQQWWFQPQPGSE